MIIRIRALFLLVAFGISVEARDFGPKRNVVYIMADDQDYGDVSILNPDRGGIPTPTMDRIAKGGMTFTDPDTGNVLSWNSKKGGLDHAGIWKSGKILS